MSAGLHIDEDDQGERWNCLVGALPAARRRRRLLCSAPSRGGPRRLGEVRRRWRSSWARWRTVTGRRPARRRAPSRHSTGASTTCRRRENVELISQLELKTPDAYKFDPDTGQPIRRSRTSSRARSRTSRSTRTRPTSRRGPSRRPAGAAASSPSTSPTRATRSSSRSSPRCPAPTTARARTRSRSTRRPSMATCWRSTTSRAAPGGVGGFDLYDVSDPASPEAARAGLRRPVARPRAGRGQGPDGAGPERRCPTARTRSSSGRTARRPTRSIVDNTEFADVDIFDITDPTSAACSSRDLDLDELGDRPGRRRRRRPGRRCGNVFLHDMVVKRINGVPIMLASYWDAGYIKLDVSDPANPRSSATPRSATRTR